VTSALKHFDGKRYTLAAFVVMNDHIHVLMHLLEPSRLENVVHSWKSFTANKMQRDHGRRGYVWQAEYFDRIVRDEDELARKIQLYSGQSVDSMDQA
jgi:REP element-mobilizing transposase RayT